VGVVPILVYQDYIRMTVGASSKGATAYELLLTDPSFRSTVSFTLENVKSLHRNKFFVRPTDHL